MTISIVSDALATGGVPGAGTVASVALPSVPVGGIYVAALTSPTCADGANSPAPTGWTKVANVTHNLAVYWRFENGTFKPFSTSANNVWVLRIYGFTTTTFFDAAGPLTQQANGQTGGGALSATIPLSTALTSSEALLSLGGSVDTDGGSPNTTPSPPWTPIGSLLVASGLVYLAIADAVDSIVGSTGGGSINIGASTGGHIEAVLLRLSSLSDDIGLFQLQLI